MRYTKQGGAGYRKRVVIEALLDRDGFICTHCGEFLVDPYDGMQTHIDHIKPVAHGGGSEPGNLQMMHSRCNISKGARK